MATLHATGAQVRWRLSYRALLTKVANVIPFGIATLRSHRLRLLVGGINRIQYGLSHAHKVRDNVSRMIDCSVLQIAPLCRRYNVICSLMCFMSCKNFYSTLQYERGQVRRADKMTRMFPKYGARDQIDESGKPSFAFCDTA